MTEHDRTPDTIEALEEVAATHRFLGMIAELQARAARARRARSTGEAEHLEAQAAFLLRLLPDATVCRACGRVRAPRRRRDCQVVRA